MEDHRDAYFFWKELGLRGGCCVHVDAHLDTCGFKVPGYTGMQQPEVNCGNYLLPAMAEGIVEELVWVVPPHLKKDHDLLSWTRDELQMWLHLTVDEFTCLRPDSGRVEGRLKGCRLVVCESDNLPDTDKPVLLDIDVDYYLGPEDEVWQSPRELQAHLAHLEPAALTIANSVQGGYTPVWLRYLGELTRQAFENPEAALEPPPAGRLAEQARDDFEDPHHKKAVELDPSYAVNPIDQACFHLERRQFEKSRPWLEQVASHDPEAATYLTGYSNFLQGNHEVALEAWESLLGQTQDKLGKRHLVEMSARTLSALGRWKEATQTFKSATRLDPSDASLWIELARCQAEGGNLRDAARSYRRAISLDSDLLIVAQGQLELARIYFELGQTSLAQAQRARLLNEKMPAALRMQAQMLALRAARQRE